MIFSSESVSEGHPDKLCDQISDAILDEALKGDPQSRVAAECYATTGLVVVGGEIKSKANLNVQSIARKVIREIGYTHADLGLDAENCCVISTMHEQSADISQGVEEGEGLYQELGAGDQGIMFGYACRQTEVYMPLPIVLAHRLVKRLADLRKSGQIAYLRPDAKAQVSVTYENASTPKAVHTIVISTQHHPDVSRETLVKEVTEQVIDAVIPAQYRDKELRVFINPTGRFVIGGPHGDTGLTGRKIIVDTYGGWARHGGGAFSGKDSTKVDRSAAYMARYIAKNMVAAGLSDEIEVQLAYAIGVAKPVSVLVKPGVQTRIEESRLIQLVNDHFELTPKGIIETLELTRPLFQQTAAYGHFGRDDLDLPWERLDKVEALRRDVQL
jgi:S-adenosylmethionine synthetase